MSLDFYLVKRCTCREMEEELFWKNITHNLGKMAAEAGIYKCLWHPEEETKAKDIIGNLEDGLKKLKDDPQHYRKFDNPGGWGKYENFVNFVEVVLDACIEFPDAEVVTST